MTKKIAVLFLYLYIALALFFPVAAFNKVSSDITQIHSQTTETIVYAADDDSPSASKPVVPAEGESLMGKFIDRNVMGVWKFMMVFVNAAVVLFLLFIAVANILRFNVDTYAIKKMLPEIIKGIVLANFSLWICRMILETSEVLLHWLQNGEAWGAIACTKSLPYQIFHALFYYGKDGCEAPWALDGMRGGSAIAGALAFIGILGIAIVASPLAAVAIVLIILIIPALFFLFFYFIFLARFYALLVLLALSPLAFFCIATPWTKKYFSQWWDTFLKWAFMGPIVFFILRLALIFGQEIYGFPRIVIMLAFTWAAIKVPFSLGSAFGIMGTFMKGLKMGGGAAGKGYGSLWNWGANGFKSKGVNVRGKQYLKYDGASDKVKGFFKKTNVYGLRDALNKRKELGEKDRSRTAMNSDPYQLVASRRAMRGPVYKDESEAAGLDGDPGNHYSALRKNIQKIPIQDQEAFIRELMRTTSPDDIDQLGMDKGLSLREIFGAKARLNQLIRLERRPSDTVDALRNRVVTNYNGGAGASPLEAAGLPAGGAAGTGAAATTLEVNANTVEVNTRGGVGANLETFMKELLEHTDAENPDSVGVTASTTADVMELTGAMQKIGLGSPDQEALVDAIRDVDMEELASDPEALNKRIDQLVGSDIDSSEVKAIAQRMSQSYHQSLNASAESFMAQSELPLTSALTVLFNKQSQFGHSVSSVAALQKQAREIADQIEKTPGLQNLASAKKLAAYLGKDLTGDINTEGPQSINAIVSRLRAAAEGMEKLKSNAAIAALNKGGNPTDIRKEVKEAIKSDFKTSFSANKIGQEISKAIQTSLERNQNIGDKTIEHLADRLESVLKKDRFTKADFAKLMPEEKKAASQEVAREVIRYSQNQVKSHSGGQVSAQALGQLFTDRRFRNAFQRSIGQSFKKVVGQMQQSAKVMNSAAKLQSNIEQPAQQVTEVNNFNTPGPPSADQISQPPTEPPTAG